jgi:hypothetical protein
VDSIARFIGISSSDTWIDTACFCSKGSLNGTWILKLALEMASMFLVAVFESGFSPVSLYPFKFLLLHATCACILPRPGMTAMSIDGQSNGCLGEQEEREGYCKYE